MIDPLTYSLELDLSFERKKSLSGYKKGFFFSWCVYVCGKPTVLATEARIDLKMEVSLVERNHATFLSGSSN
jgi:hypothetical protein